MQTTKTLMLAGLKEPANDLAWSEFSETYRPVIVAFGRRLGLNEQDALDAAQETLLAFLSGYRQGRYDRSKGRLRNWLLAIARNKVLYLRRQNGRLVSPPPNDSSTEFLERIPDEHTISEVWEAQWREALIRRSLDAIRNQCEPTSIRAFELVTLKETPAEEAAAQLGMTVNAVLKANRRVLSRMRELHRVFEEER